jgi:MFS family permease
VNRAGGWTLGLGRDTAILFWGLVVYDLGLGLYTYLFPIFLEDELGASATQIGLLLGVQGIFRILVNIPGGIIAERYSRRWIIVLTTLVTVPATVVYILSGSWWHALPGMLLFICANMGTPSFSSYLAEAGSETDRGRAFAMVYVVGPSVALAVSPAIGGWLAEATSFKTVLAFTTLFSIFSTVIFLGLSERRAVVHAGSSVGYRDVFNIPVVRAVGLLQFTLLGAIAIGVTLLPNYLKDVHGLSVGSVGWFGSIAAVGSTILSLTIGRIKWVTPIRAIAISCLCVGMLCLLTLSSGNIVILAMAFLGRGGFSVAWALFAALLSETVMPRMQGRAFAIAEFMGAIGFGLAPFAAGALYDWQRDSTLIVTLTASPILAGLTIWVGRRYVRPAAEARSKQIEFERQASMPEEGALAA